MQAVQVQSLVKELRIHMLYGTAKKNKTFIISQVLRVRSLAMAERGSLLRVSSDWNQGFSGVCVFLEL